jgi:hypothetical protein
MVIVCTDPPTTSWFGPIEAMTGAFGFDGELGLLSEPHALATVKHVITAANAAALRRFFPMRVISYSLGNASGQRRR